LMRVSHLSRAILVHYKFTEVVDAVVSLDT
jgi:hypothetical protein